MYPLKSVQQKLSGHLELCRWLYNRLLEESNRAKIEGKKVSQLDTQALIVELKRNKTELNNVYSSLANGKPSAADQYPSLG